MNHAAAQEALIETHCQLTARHWSPLNIPRDRYLEVLEGACRFSARHQDADGAIIDPYTHREMQYSTPYFAYAIGTLVRAGRARELLPRGLAAMEHSTLQFAAGRAAIPDQHGEFFIAVLTESLDVYGSLIPPERLETWRQRLRTPIAAIVGTGRNNWMTYSMKGEWLRSTHGLVSHQDAVRFIEDSWQSEQRSRSLPTPFHLYHDKSSDPDTLSVEVVGRGNLLAMIADGYNGPSADEIRRVVEDGTRTTLLLQDPTGQVPVNGRTDDHVWVDVGYQLAFQVMANREWAAGHKEAAAVYQHASELSFAGLDRWKHTDGEWAGSYFITKNHFDPGLRVGYQDASQISNYTGSLMFHLAEVYNAREQKIPERPAPAEIGGYAIALDPGFDSVMANAGGMQVQLNLRGQKEKSSGNYWTPLGMVRFAHAGWDSRMGPSDGALTEAGGVSFAPEFLEDGQWLRLASLSSRYRAFWKTEFVHPALVRGVMEYRPLPGSQGPAFESRVWITPDGVYIKTRKTSRDAVPWAVTWPLLQNDGRPLDVRVSEGIASTSFVGSGDIESFLAVGVEPRLTRDGPPLRSTFGDLLPLRVQSTDGVDRTFVYPHNSGQPAAERVRSGFRPTADGFKSDLGTVHGDIYVGRTVAGGMGREIVLPPANGNHIQFNLTCGFLFQLSNGAPVMVETDRDVVLTTKGRRIRVPAHQPTRL
jgi:hypothetical protein